MIVEQSLSQTAWMKAVPFAAKALVEAYARADAAQRVAIHNYQQMTDKQAADVEALRQNGMATRQRYLNAPSKTPIPIIINSC